MKICQMLHRAYQLNDEAFIREIFYQLLNREAEEHDVRDLLHVRTSGTPRINMIVGIACSPEAQTMYAQPYVWTSDRQPTVADKLQHLFKLGNEDLVHHAYVELLGRTPESWGYMEFLHILERGEPRINVLSLILQSHEFTKLMNTDRYYFTRTILAHFFNNL